MYPPEFKELAALLVARGFEPSPTQGAVGFGDSSSEFKGPEFVLRMVSDRGQYFSEVAASDKAEWFDVPLLALVIQGSGPDIMTSSEQVDFILRNLSSIESLIATSDGRKLLADARLIRAKRRMPGLFP